MQIKPVSTFLNLDQTKPISNFLTSMQAKRICTFEFNANQTYVYILDYWADEDNNLYVIKRFCKFELSVNLTVQSMNVKCFLGGNH